MINAVGPINNVYSKPVQFRGTPQETVQDKKGMTTTQKTLVGLGALAAIVAGGLLLKNKALKFAEKELCEIVDKGKLITRKNVLTEYNSLLKRLGYDGKSDVREFIKQNQYKLYAIRLEGSSLKNILQNSKLSKDSVLFEAVKIPQGKKGVALIVSDKNDNTLVAKTFVGENFDKPFLDTFKKEVTKVNLTDKIGDLTKNLSLN